MKMMKTKQIIRTYSELSQISDFLDRFNYLKLNGRIGDETFGSRRYINQLLYKSGKWLKTRDDIIIRDNGCDLGIQDMPIVGKIYVHHIDPITEEDILSDSSKLYDPDNLICSSFNTHEAIHFGDTKLLDDLLLITRCPNDTCLWKK